MEATYCPLPYVCRDQPAVPEPQERLDPHTHIWSAQYTSVAQASTLVKIHSYLSVSPARSVCCRWSSSHGTEAANDMSAALCTVLLAALSLLVYAVPPVNSRPSSRILAPVS
jgi:hypothetical protein